MQKKLLLISDRKTDTLYFMEICNLLSFNLDQSSDPDEINKRILSGKRPLIVVDSDNHSLFKDVEKTLKMHTNPTRLFAFADKSFSQAGHISQYQICGHHLLRRSDPHTLALYSKIMNSALNPERNTLADYFDKDIPISKIVLKRTTHKKAAIDAIQNVLTKKGVMGRIAALVAQSTDELILNAIFNAPSDEFGRKYRISNHKEVDLSLTEKEYIEVKMAATESYMGVSVKDRFGSLTRQSIMGNIQKPKGKDLMNSETLPPKIGLSRVLQSGLSLLVATEPKVSTEVMLFFRLTENYKIFKKSFQFLSLIFPS